MNSLKTCVNTYYIDKHCSSENEMFCPRCGENMYIKEDDDSVVKCDADDCGHEIDMTEDYSEGYEDDRY